MLLATFAMFVAAAPVDGNVTGGVGEEVVQRVLGATTLETKPSSGSDVLTTWTTHDDDASQSFG